MSKYRQHLGTSLWEGRTAPVPMLLLSMGTRRAAPCPLPAPGEGGHVSAPYPWCIPRTPSGDLHVAGSSVAPWLQLNCKSMERHCCLLGVAWPNGSKGGEKREGENTCLNAVPKQELLTPRTPVWLICSDSTSPSPTYQRLGRGTCRDICHTGSLSGP